MLVTKVTKENELCRIYESRQDLNAKVLSLLAAPTQGSQTVGSSKQGNQAAELRSTLEQLQANLAEEQILESEHHHAIMRDILTNRQVNFHAWHEAGR